MRDIKEITSAARTRHGEEHAVTVSLAFRRGFENIATFPHLGPAIAPGDQRRTIVLRVFDARRDMQGILDRWPRQ